MSSSLTTAEKDLIDRVNYGVNIYVRRLPGLSISKSPNEVVTSRCGTSSEMAFLKLSQLHKGGFPIEKLAMATCHGKRCSIALVRSEWSGWLGGKHPCWLVLDHDNLAIRPVHKSPYRKSRLEVQSLAGLFLTFKGF